MQTSSSPIPWRIVSMTESAVSSRLYVERAMCGKCDTLRRQIAATRLLSAGLTDPASIVLNKADIKALEESLIKAIAKHRPSGDISRLRNDTPGP